MYPHSTAQAFTTPSRVLHPMVPPGAACYRYGVQYQNMKTRLQGDTDALCPRSDNWRILIALVLMGGALACATLAANASADSSVASNRQAHQQRAMVLPPVPASSIEALKEQKFGTTKGRFPIGTGRALEAPLVVNRSTVPGSEDG